MPAATRSRKTTTTTTTTWICPTRCGRRTSSRSSRCARARGEEREGGRQGGRQGEKRLSSAGPEPPAPAPPAPPTPSARPERCAWASQFFTQKEAAALVASAEEGGALYKAMDAAYDSWRQAMEEEEDEDEEDDFAWAEQVPWKDEL